MAYDPTQPLKHDREEAYAQQRSLGYSPTESGRNLGWNVRSGAISKCEAKPRVQRRIAHLRRRDLSDAMLAEKRKQIAERLELIAAFNLLDFVRRDADGHLIDGEPHVDWDALSDSECAIAINEFRYDKDTGRLVHFRRDDRLAAIAQLRDMYGLKAPTISHAEITGKNGASLIPEYTDEQRAAALAVFLAKNRKALAAAEG